jgi:hypothetical protein
MTAKHGLAVFLMLCGFSFLAVNGHVATDPGIRAVAVLHGGAQAAPMILAGTMNDSNTSHEHGDDSGDSGGGGGGNNGNNGN